MSTITENGLFEFVCRQFTVARRNIHTHTHSHTPTPLTGRGLAGNVSEQLVVLTN